MVFGLGSDYVAGCSGEVGDGGFVGACAGAECGGGHGWAVELGESGARESGVGAGEKLGRGAGRGR